MVLNAAIPTFILAPRARGFARPGVGLWRGLIGFESADGTDDDSAKAFAY